MDQAAPNRPRSNRSARLAWLFCGVVTLFALINFVRALSDRQFYDNSIELATALAGIVFPIVYAAVAALIISHQPRNRIGWLLMSPAAGITAINVVDSYLGRFTTAPQPTLPNLLAAWFQNWSWLLLIVPLLLILLLFPTGKPPSPRWRWVGIYAALLTLSFIFLVTFSENISPANGGWQLPNPIGWIPDNPEIGATLVTSWVAGLALLTILCAASLFVRFRHASSVERAQIKWLLYTAAVFVVFYVPLLSWQGDPQSIANDIANLLLFISTTLFPAAIAIAILRYRLWDIDVLIRRTLSYGALTLTLGLVYFGSVILLQKFFQSLTGQQSPAAVVVSTLIIAALFTPLRSRIQEGIDRRFYRRKYDAEKALASFAARARNEVELDHLSAYLVEVVRETMQPEKVSLWLRSTEKKRPAS